MSANVIPHPAARRIPVHQRAAPKLSEGVVKAYGAILKTYGVPVHELGDGADVVRASMLLTFFVTAINWQALSFSPFATYAKLPHRAALIDAIRSGDGSGIVDAYLAAKPYGLPEIIADFDKLVTLPFTHHDH